VGLTAFYLATTVPNIGNHPVAGGDEGWIISASAKLAERGVFGSDLFTGLFGAQDRYYFNLPLYHLGLAAAFKVAGVGLAQARAVSAFFGLLTLALTYLLGRRLAGPWVGTVAAGLLVLLRLNLTPFTGLTLTDLGATVRYDLIAVPFALGAALLLLPKAKPPSERRVAAAGLVLGLGCLTQFIDFLFLAPFGLFLLTEGPSSPGRRLRLAGVLGFAAALPFLPYCLYVATDWHDFRGQSRTFEQKSSVFSPSFYLDNLRHEPDRYNLGLAFSSPVSASELAQRPSARLALLVLGPAALVYTAGRARGGSAGHRMLALVLAALVIQFALLESTKRFVYWVAVVPFLCVAIADAALALLRWRPRARAIRLAGVTLATAAALLIVGEGAAVGLRNVRDAFDAPDFAAVGSEVREVVPPGSRVVADNRMWLTLRDMDVRSLHLLFYWTNPRIAGEELTDISGAMARIDADYMLLSPLAHEMLANLSPADSRRLQAYMSQHARLVAIVSHRPYGPIEVYRLSR
jgi:4-amino-4-deoxy-L-arabinose transferase-like glycosyltransferase